MKNIVTIQEFNPEPLAPWTNTLPTEEKDDFGYHCSQPMPEPCLLPYLLQYTTQGVILCSNSVGPDYPSCKAPELGFAISHSHHVLMLQEITMADGLPFTEIQGLEYKLVECKIANLKVCTTSYIHLHISQPQGQGITCIIDLLRYRHSHCTISEEDIMWKISGGTFVWQVTVHDIKVLFVWM